MHVLRYKRNEMVAVQLVGSYCLPSLLYGCGVWQTRAMMLDQQVLHGITAFGRFLMLAGGKVSDHCYSFVHVYHWLISFTNGGCSTGRNVCFLTMYYCRPWPDVVMITLALCDVYKLTVKNLVESPKHLVKELFWREFEWSHILWQCIVLCSDYFVFDCVLILCAFMFCCLGVINDVCIINSQLVSY